MSSPGIDKWIKKAPESWVKLAKKTGRKTTFELFKKKFFENAEKENKSYLKEHLSEDNLKEIYHESGGTLQTTTVKEFKPTRIQIQSGERKYTRTTTPRYGLNSKLVLNLAAKEKPRTPKYNEFVNILISQGRTRQAAIKKIQRTRRANK